MPLPFCGPKKPVVYARRLADKYGLSLKKAFKKYAPRKQNLSASFLLLSDDKLRQGLIEVCLKYVNERDCREAYVASIKQCQQSRARSEFNLKQFLHDNFTDKIIKGKKYKNHAALVKGLKYILRELKGDTISTNEKKMVVKKLTENIFFCIEGFDARVHETLQFFIEPKCIFALLQKIRDDLIGKALLSRGVQEVHATNSYYTEAHGLGLNVTTRNLNDQYQGNIALTTIRKDIKTVFEREYHPFAILQALLAQVRSVLSNKLYVGRKKDHYVDVEYSAYLEYLATILGEKSLDFYEYLVMDDAEFAGVVDINWSKVAEKLYQRCLALGIFKLNKVKLLKYSEKAQETFIQFDAIKRCHYFWHFLERGVSAFELKLFLDNVYRDLNAEERLYKLDGYRSNFGRPISYLLQQGRIDLLHVLLDFIGGDSIETRLLNVFTSTVSLADALTIFNQLTEEEFDYLFSFATVKSHFQHFENDQCQTALILAANHGHDKAIRHLLRHEAQVNTISSGYGYYAKRTALHQSILSGHESIALLLLDNEADWQIPYGAKKQSVISLACEYGMVNVVKRLFPLYGEQQIDEIKGESLTELLKLALTYCHVDVAAFLLSQNAALPSDMTLDSQSISAFFADDKQAVIELLHQYLPEVLGKLSFPVRQDSYSLMDFALYNGASNIIKTLNKLELAELSLHPSTWLGLNKAIDADDVDWIEALDQAYPTLLNEKHTYAGQSQSRECLCPLTYAIRCKKIKAAAFLLAEYIKRDIPLPDYHLLNKTMIELVKDNHVDMIEMLLKHYPDACAICLIQQGRYSVSILQYASTNGYDKMTDLVMAVVAKDALSNSGNKIFALNGVQQVVAPLFNIVQQNDFFRARKLIQLGAKINVRDADSLSVFHLLVNKKNYLMARYLMRKGVNVHTSSHHLTPFYSALLYAHTPEDWDFVMDMIDHDASVLHYRLNYKVVKNIEGLLVDGLLREVKRAPLMVIKVMTKLNIEALNQAMLPYKEVLSDCIIEQATRHGDTSYLDMALDKETVLGDYFRTHRGYKGKYKPKFVYTNVESYRNLVKLKQYQETLERREQEHGELCLMDLVGKYQEQGRILDDLLSHYPQEKLDLEKDALSDARKVALANMIEAAIYRVDTPLDVAESLSDFIDTHLISDIKDASVTQHYYQRQKEKAMTVIQTWQQDSHEILQFLPGGSHYQSAKALLSEAFATEFDSWQATLHHLTDISAQVIRFNEQSPFYQALIQLVKRPALAQLLKEAIELDSLVADRGHPQQRESVSAEAEAGVSLPGAVNQDRAQAVLVV